MASHDGLPKEGKKESDSHHGHSRSKKKTSQQQNVYSHLPMDRKAKNKLDRSVTEASRPCEEHSFLTDVADVREMEQGLLGLLEDFHSGKLRAFGGGGTFEKMDQIREQQEKLARLHFEMDIQQDMHRLNSDEARTTANDNLSKLIDQLHGLSTSIQTLQTHDTNGGAAAGADSKF
ncbi:coiled-coil domain-containing protein 28B-like [Haliotis asinina]|uniref:coiled-coil domain-containing protein 28B-like n=1 Tax=Haliotis asinina TaxID=109174 RepID=UPI00353210CF